MLRLRVRGRRLPRHWFWHGQCAGNCKNSARIRFMTLLDSVEIVVAGASAATKVSYWTGQMPWVVGAACLPGPM
jgi:hypothetical protein